MRRLAHPLLSAVVLALAPVSARAQVAIEPALVVTRDGEELENEPFSYVTKSDCDRNVSYEFTVQYETAPNVVEAWVGVGTVNCSAPSNRLRAFVSSVSPTCKLVGRIAEPTTTASISVDAVELFSKDTLAAGFGQENADDAGAEASGGDDRAATSCDSVVNQNYTLFFIPLPGETNDAANVAYEPLSGVGHGTLSARFTLYTILPTAPSNLRPRTGVAAIGVRFEPLLGASVRTRYKAYFDWGSGDDQACGSGALVADMPAPDESDTIEAVLKRQAVTGTTMPQAEPKPTAAERKQLGEWLDCGPK